MSLIWQNKKKNDAVHGTWQKRAFQCTLCEDPQETIPLSAGTGYHKLTHCTTTQASTRTMRPNFPELLVRLPGHGFLSRSSVPGVGSALQAELGQLSSVQAYLAVHRPDDVNSIGLVRFCFQFCQCVQDACVGLSKVQSRAVEIPVQVGLFPYSNNRCSRIGKYLSVSDTMVKTTATLSSTAATLGASRQRVTMKTKCSLNLANAIENEMHDFIGLFSLCVVDNNSASPTTTETGKTGCLTLHVFPGMNSSAEQVAAAIRAECRLGPLLDRLRLIGHEGGDSEKSENIFHHITSTLDSICRRPL